MRIAVLVVSLLFLLGLGLQSCAVTVGGGWLESLSTADADKTEYEQLQFAGLIGLLTAFIWIFGAAFVISKPKASMVLFLVSIPFALIGGALGYNDLFLWAVAAALFAAGSWRGITEQQNEDQRRLAALGPPAPPPAAGGWHPDPWHAARLRYHDGRDWTAHTSD
jgi:hypothetical protein